MPHPCNILPQHHLTTYNCDMRILRENEQCFVTSVCIRVWHSSTLSDEMSAAPI